MYNSQHEVFKIKRRRGACKSCKERKIRCNGERPCNSCRRGDLNCVYPVSSSRKSSQNLRPLNTAIVESISKPQPLNPRLESTPHRRNFASIDSGIAGCDFPVDYQVSLSVPELVVSDNNPQIMSLEKTYKSLKEPTINEIVPIKSLLRHLQENLRNKDYMPAHVSNCLEKLVLKIEALKSNLRTELISKNLSEAAFDSKKLRLGVQYFFEKCNLGQSYLAKWNIERILERLANDSPPEDLMLLYGVVSLGLQSFGEDDDSTAYAELASSLHLEIIRGQASVMKLQSLATLLLCQLHHSTLEMSSLVSSTINMLKSLELNKLSVIRNTYSREYPEEILKNLVWLLWSIDSIVSMEEKHTRSLSIESIEFPPPVKTKNTAETTTFSLGIVDFCEYAHICWTIVSNIQSKALKLFTASETTYQIDDEFMNSVLASLRHWKLKASQQSAQRECSEQTLSQINQPTERSESMYVFSRYNITLLAALENLSACHTSEDVDHYQSSMSRHASLELEIARSVLTHLNAPKNSVLVFENFSYINLYIVSWCIIFREILKGTREPDDITLLIIASGLFAQFSLSSKVDPGFKEIADLGSVATSIVRNLDTVSQQAGFQGLDESICNLSKNTHFPSEPWRGKFQQTTWKHSEISDEPTTDVSTSPKLSGSHFSSSWLINQDFDDQFWDSGFGSGESWNTDEGKIDAGPS